MNARRLCLALWLLALLACTPSAPTPSVTRPTERDAMPSQPGAESAEELKAQFFQHHRAGNVEAMMSLFYLKGASADMVALYRRGVPKPEEEVVTSVEVSEIAEERRSDSPHTLAPEKLLLIKYRRPEPSETGAVEQFFYIGRSEGRFFLTLPTGQ